MTTGPTDGKVTTPAGGPGGMPLALRLSEGLGIADDAPSECASGIDDETSEEVTARIRRTYEALRLAIGRVLREHY